MTAWELHQGEALDLLADLPAGSVDAVVTDPPYSTGGMVRSDRTTSTISKYVSTGATVRGHEFSGDNRDQRSYLAWSELWMRTARRATRTGGHLIVFADWRQLPTTTDAVQAAGWVWRGVVTWAKPVDQARPVKGGFRNQAEYVIWATVGPHTPDDDAPYLPGVIQAGSPRGQHRVHITQKPLDLLTQLVQVAPVDGLILDPFAGSGTTGIAAIQTGRRFVGAESHPDIATVARDRIAAAAGDWTHTTTPNLFTTQESTV